MSESKFIARTDDEVVARIQELGADDFFGFERADLIETLPWELAIRFLNLDSGKFSKKEWKQRSRERDDVLALMLDYMPFAWNKANDCRGLSASRSMSHYAAWVWLLRVDFGDLSEYEFYGKPNLVRICEHFGWDHKQWDNGVWTNTSD
jgi:hypothetical protein